MLVAMAGVNEGREAGCSASRYDRTWVIAFVCQASICFAVFQVWRWSYSMDGPY